MNKDKFLELYNQKLNDIEIAQLLNYSHWTIRDWRKALKLPSNTLSVKIKDDVVNLLQQGNSDEQVAKILNVSPSHINYVRNKLQLPPKMIERSYKNEIDRRKGYLIRNVKFSAKRRNLDFDLDYTDLELPLTCPILEIPLEYTQKKGYFIEANYATLDRIDNTKGYIKGNVIVMSRLANAMKNQADFNQIEKFSANMQKIINHYKNEDALGSITDIFPDIILKT